jgi:hypothetical protein
MFVIVSLLCRHNAPIALTPADRRLHHIRFASAIAARQPSRIAALSTG